MLISKYDYLAGVHVSHALLPVLSCRSGVVSVCFTGATGSAEYVLSCHSMYTISSHYLHLHLQYVISGPAASNSLICELPILVPFPWMWLSCPHICVGVLRPMPAWAWV